MARSNLCPYAFVWGKIENSNDDPWLTFDFFMARSNLRHYAFVWGNIENLVSQNVLKNNG